MSNKPTPSPFRFVSDDNSPKTIYVDKAEMLSEIREYQDQIKLAENNNQPEPQMSNELGAHVLAICTNMARRHNFRNYTFVTEMISDGVILGLRLCKTFDVSHPSSNPFSYFSFSIFRSFLTNIKYEKAQLAGKYEYVLQLDIDTSAYQEHDKDNHNNQYIAYLQEYIDEAKTFKEKHIIDETDIVSELDISIQEIDTIKRAARYSKYAELGF